MSEKPLDVRILAVARDLTRLIDSQSDKEYLRGYETATALIFQIVNMADTIEDAKKVLAQQLRGVQAMRDKESITADADAITKQMDEADPQREKAD